MNKILCKRDFSDITGGIILFFYQGTPYSYTTHPQGIYEIFDRDRKSAKYYSSSLDKYFYTPEETLVILRNDNIKNVLNDE